MNRTDEAGKLLRLATEDLELLRKLTEAGHSWSDVAGTAAVNLRVLADFLDAMRNGETHWKGCNLEGKFVFPSLQKGSGN